MNVLPVIFSKDRPLQLDLTLKTLKMHCVDFEDAVVLYKQSEEYKKSYDECSEDNKQFLFVKENNFKKNLISTLEGWDYVMFVVDDCIFTGDFSLEKITKNWRDDQIGFSLRLGANINFCYTVRQPQYINGDRGIFDKENGIVYLDWTRGEYDFGYPFDVSSSIFKVNSLWMAIHDAEYKGPNGLEDSLSRLMSFYAIDKPRLGCYKQSVAFCSPMNSVQTEYRENRISGRKDVRPELLKRMYDEGFRLDPNKFNGFVSSSPHQEVDLW